ncbi:hypothetical protein PIB30_073909 [Stylosanthes scabra]|uniref:Uncharacterized protein n=1 Tax=Stylosanthes scabra TaxID=79078 RepID=A0ABU6TP57_9FABA|nr:hypothetical protein [Stylosanthes scabra]
MENEDDPEFTNGDIEGLERLIYTDNAMPSYPNDGGDMEIDAGMPDVVMEPSNIAYDNGLRLSAFDGWKWVGLLDEALWLGSAHFTKQNLKINRQREEEMRFERQRYQWILDEAAAQRAKEQNKGKARRDEDEDDDDDDDDEDEDEG